MTENSITGAISRISRRSKSVGRRGSAKRSGARSESQSVVTPFKVL
jgi:hypothetical protein